MILDTNSFPLLASMKTKLESSNSSPCWARIHIRTCSFNWKYDWRYPEAFTLRIICEVYRPLLNTLKKYCRMMLIIKHPIFPVDPHTETQRSIKFFRLELVPPIVGGYHSQKTPYAYLNACEWLLLEHNSQCSDANCITLVICTPVFYI